MMSGNLMVKVATRKYFVLNILNTG